eukprot:TRINITY_DN835_c0_g2_i3.p1 TRINITY_DN835_c0_g2~~TRINITY_DN835_c0_g2_i3.p1  ORF type:complete len:407 (+),score=38.96 TRINITY_DN835_c0_g2_i3:391-1611(+)
MSTQSTLQLCQRVKEKQRVCAEKTKTVVHKLFEVISGVIQDLESCEEGQEGRIIEKLSKEVQKSVAAKTVENTTREFHKAISNFKEKVIDEEFSEDLCESMQDTKMDFQVLNQIIIEHFYREREFELGDMLAEEAGLFNIHKIRQGYINMQTVLRDLDNRSVETALQFVQENRHKIEDRQISDSFEFSLHQLKFFTLFGSNESNIRTALDYARQNISKFVHQYPQKVQKLMGYFIFSQCRDMHTMHNMCNMPNHFNEVLSHYGGFTTYLDKYWYDVKEQFIRLCCVVLNQSFKSPLLVTVSAGSIALPQIAKMMKKIGHMKNGLKGMPLEIDLGEEFMFHSIFACPVSKEQSTPNNPPMMLPCGHVLCEDSIRNITTTITRPFKCPYCPSETTAQNCRKLIFPVVR